MSAEHTRDEGLLLEIIGTVGSTLDLERVLAAIVRLLSELASCHACFVYLEDGAGGLVLRAASPPHSEHVGTIRLAPGEGLVGWVCREREPAFVRDRVLDDPRVVYVPDSTRSTSTRWWRCRCSGTTARPSVRSACTRTARASSAARSPSS